MRKTRFIVALLLLASRRENFASAIELNGITSLCGEKIACFALSSATTDKPVGFLLEEGQSRYGIKLLSVDFVRRRVQIAENGVERFIGLCHAPELISPAQGTGSDSMFGEASGAPEQWQVSQYLQTDESAQRIRSGDVLVDPTYFGASYPLAGGAGSASSGSADSASAPRSSANSSSGETGTSGPTTDYKKQYWYVESLNIERNRLATAGEVMKGETEPLPRTPLTPATTPDSLVGKETLFANHFADFLVTDLSTD